MKKRVLYFSGEQAKILYGCIDNYGYLTMDDIEILLPNEYLRLCQCLIRCGGMRAIVSLQDVKHFVKIINHEASDYVRDVAFTASQLETLKEKFQL